MPLNKHKSAEEDTTSDDILTSELGCESIKR